MSQINLDNLGRHEIEAIAENDAWAGQQSDFRVSADPSGLLRFEWYCTTYWSERDRAEALASANKRWIEELRDV